MSSDKRPVPLADTELSLLQARRAITDGDSPAWAELLQGLAASLPGTRMAPDEAVETIRELLQSEKFLALEDSWNLMHFLLHNWTWLSAEQTRLLREPIAGAFDRFAHWLGGFIAGAARARVSRSRHHCA